MCSACYSSKVQTFACKTRYYAYLFSCFLLVAFVNLEDKSFGLRQIPKFFFYDSKWE